MKIILITLCLVFITSMSFALIDKAPAIPLEWWLRNQNKFKDADISTTEKDGEYLIVRWNVEGVSKPTDEEINKIISDYEKLPKQKTLEDRVKDLEKKIA